MSVSIHKAERLFRLSGRYTLDDVRRRYVSLCRQYHPDSVVGGASDPDLNHKMAAINDVYRVLRSQFVPGVSSVLSSWSPPRSRRSSKQCEHPVSSSVSVSVSVVVSTPAQPPASPSVDASSSAYKAFEDWVYCFPFGLSVFALSCWLWYLLYSSLDFAMKVDGSHLYSLLAMLLCTGLCLLALYCWLSGLTSSLFRSLILGVAEFFRRGR